MNGELQAALEHRIMTGTTFMGVPAQKNPIDAWVYQELIHELRPDVIVEVGNKHGGSLLYLAELCRTIRHGYVVGVDLDPVDVYHPRLKTVTGDALAVFEQVQEFVNLRTCLVIEDSSHTYQNTLDVLNTYGQLIHPGGYLICEDGVMADVAAAIATFVHWNPDFVADESREWPITWNPGGYLRRVA